MKPELRISILKPTERISATAFWLFALIFSASFFSGVVYQLYKLFKEDGSIPLPLIAFGIVALLLSGVFFIASIIGLKYSFLGWQLVFSKEENQIWIERKNKRTNSIKMVEPFSIMTRVKSSGEQSFSWELLLSKPTGEKLIMDYQISDFSFQKIDKSRREYCRPIENYLGSEVIHLNY